VMIWSYVAGSIAIVLDIVGLFFFYRKPLYSKYILIASHGMMTLSLLIIPMCSLGPDDVHLTMPFLGGVGVLLSSMILTMLLKYIDKMIQYESGDNK